jgi:uncharacterized ferritin-like protein (DUF455 family)
METFPFTEAEWAAVIDASFAIMNAGFSDDTVMQDSHFVELQEVLATLRACYGDHPVLLETEADFTDDDFERLALYQRAVAISEQNALPTLSIRLSAARLLIDTGCHAAALRELNACQFETQTADSDDAAEWSRLRSELQCG